MSDKSKDTLLQSTAEHALKAMRRQGFEHAQVSASTTAQDEVNVNHNEPSLLRSTETIKLSLLGIIDGRMASAELADFTAEAVDARIAALFDDAKAAPQDDANAVSSAQSANIVQGPQEADLDLLASKVQELLRFREQETPKMLVDEGAARHMLARIHTLTSGGSTLSCSVGWYGLDVMGTAKDGKQASSFNFTGGASDELASRHVTEYFGIGGMMRDTEQQIHTRPLGAKFVGDVVLTPAAVNDLLSWFLGQIADTQLIAGTSLYRERVGQQVASGKLGLRSRFTAPGVVPLSSDAFKTPEVQLLDAGTLKTLTPSLYGSRKTGIPHVPVAQGWEILSGDASREQVVGGVVRGAVVGRLSMGSPASNGDFSGVIKNSFAIDGGQVSHALSETMITGNMAQMLMNVAAVSRERIDYGALALPWLRITGLHFS